MTVIDIKKKEFPLVVDLDGTLIKTDLLYESIIQCIKKNPLMMFLILFWLCKGKAALKSQLALLVRIEPETLPYNNDFLTYLKNEFNNGHILILATASHKTYAEQIASYLGIFKGVYATDDKINCKGTEKAKICLSRFGEKGFDYAGDSKADLKIFKIARKVVLVRPSKAVQRKTKKNGNVDREFIENRGQLFQYLKAIRIHQWLKNGLIFVPLITSHKLFDLSLLFTSITGFFALCLCASGTYIINDLFDLNSDRSHPRKKMRPFASGDIPILKGVVLSSLLIVSGLTISIWLDSAFSFVLCGYIGLTLGYSLVFKTIALVDTILLASLYTIRVIAGALLIEVNLSFWLITFSIFIFYCLALLKRVTELQNLSNSGCEKINGRGYSLQDANTLRGMGISSGLLSIIVFALYINSSDMLLMYSRPQVLWLICPLLLYWINMLWLKTGREEMHDDPIVFTIKDHQSQIVFGLVAMLLAFASG